MSFILAPQAPLPDATFTPRPIKLSGQDGPIARYLTGKSELTDQPWTLSGVDLIGFLAENPDSVDVFFCPFALSAPPPTCTLYHLQEIHGVSHHFRSDLVLRFSPRPCVSLGDGNFRLSPSSGTRHFCEAISLTGGTCGGLWQWTEAPLQMGAAILAGGAL